MNNDRICGCYNVTIEEVIKAKENGCTSVEEIVKETNVGRGLW